MQPAPPIADQTASDHASALTRVIDDTRSTIARDTWPEHHVHRIAGRVRLVQRGVEFAQAEREVDGVDVFEGRREKRNM